MYHKLPIPIALLCCLFYSCLSNSKEKSVQDIAFLNNLNKEILTAENKDSLLIYRSALLQEQGYNELAMRDCQKVWENTHSEEAALCKNSVYVNQKKYTESIEWLSKCITLFNRSVLIRYALASSLLEKGEKTKATSILSSIPIESSSPEEAFHIASILSEMQRYDKALLFCNKACKASEATAPYLLKAHIMIELKHKNTLPLLDSMANTSPFKEDFLPDIYYLYGNYWLSHQHNEQAINYYQKATNIEWRFQSAYIGQAQALKELGEYEEALQQLTIASEVDRPTKTLMAEAADCLLSLKDTAEAVEYLHAALLIDPTDTALQKQLDKLSSK